MPSSPPPLAKVTTAIRKTITGSPDQHVTHFARSKLRRAITGDPDARIREMLRRELDRHTTLVEKLSFTLGIVNGCITELIALRWPHYLPHFYLYWLVPLLVYRMSSYKAARQHLFLIDFCYAVNVLCGLLLIGFPGSTYLHAAVFAACNGPVMVAIMAWRNSFVPHSLDKMTSLFIHILPPLVTWSLRWFPSPVHEPAVRALNAQLSTCEDVTNLPLAGSLPWLHAWLSTAWCNALFLVPAVSAYLAWQVLYLVITEVFQADALAEDPDLQTSARWLLRARSGIIYHTSVRMLRKAGILGPEEHLDSETWLGKAAFIMAQAVYTAVTFMIVPFMWHSYWAHTTALCVSIVCSVWNGASFYFTVYFHKRLQALMKTEQFAEVAAAAAAAAAAEQDDPPPRQPAVQSIGSDQSSDETQTQQQPQPAGQARQARRRSIARVHK